MSGLVGNLGEKSLVIEGGLLPSGTVVSVHQSGLGSDLSMTAATAYFNNVSLSFKPKSATSNFIVIMAARYTRGSTASAAYLGYTMKNGSLATADITNHFVTDDTRHNYNTALFKAYSGLGSPAVTWDVGDTLYFGSFAQSNGISATLSNYNLTVFEYMS
tara:strand:- start:311 stop:790 length:480 start_codon:yes stop_codon:yes gene_type:complete